MIEKMILEQVEILRDHLNRGEIVAEFVQHRAQMIYTLSLSLESTYPEPARAVAHEVAT